MVSSIPSLCALDFNKTPSPDGTIKTYSRQCQISLASKTWPWLRSTDLWEKVFQISTRDPRNTYPLLPQCPHPVVSEGFFSSLFSHCLSLISALYQGLHFPQHFWGENRKRTQEKMLSNGTSHFLGGWRGEVKGTTLEINVASCSILPRIRTTLSHTPCNHELVSRRQAMKKAVYFSLLSALLDRQLAASTLYFKKKTSLLLCVHSFRREFLFYWFLIWWPVE